jgi:hypothetical protein
MEDERFRADSGMSARMPRYRTSGSLRAECPARGDGRRGQQPLGAGGCPVTGKGAAKPSSRRSVASRLTGRKCGQPCAYWSWCSSCRFTSWPEAPSKPARLLLGVSHLLATIRPGARRAHAGGLKGSAQHFVGWHCQGGCGGTWLLREVDAQGARRGVGQVEGWAGSEADGS